MTVDMAALKDTRITEALRVQFRAEAFNILNGANFASPGVANFTGGGAINPVAGVIQNVVTSARKLQLGLKFLF